MKKIKNEFFLRFEAIEEFFVVGCSLQMSMTDFKVSQVWKEFMESKNLIEQLDHRPHFIKLPINYDLNNPIVSKEIYIPLK